MKKSIKKRLLGLGTVAAVASPIAAVISCGSSTQNTINWKDSDDYGGIQAQSFLQEIKHLGKTKQNSINVAQEKMMQVQYESESIKSFKIQHDQFKFEVWKLGIEIKKLTVDKTQATTDQGTATDQDVKDDYQTQIDALDKSIKEKNDRIVKVNGFIGNLDKASAGIDFTTKVFIISNAATKAFFEDPNYKAEDYPEVYKSLKTIKDDKTKIVNDAYRNFYPQFTTREAGDKEWPAELAKSYGGAATFAQAIDYLVTQEISAKAFNTFKFDIFKTFTVEQKLWQQYIDPTSFLFLKDSKHSTDLDDDIALIGTTKADIEANIIKINNGDSIGTGANAKVVSKSTLTSSEIFMGSKSPNHELPANAYDTLGSVVKYQHLLIKATEGATPDDVWTIAGADLVKLMSYVQVQQGTSTSVVQGASFLSSADLFKTDSDKDTNDKLLKETDFILKAISGNSAGTLTIQGSLGVKSELEYIKAMVPGFSLGNLANEGLAAGKVAEIDLGVLASKLNAALEIEVKKTHTAIPGTVSADKLDATNIDIAATITELGDDKVKSIFGRVLKDFFTGKTDLVYKVTGTDNFLVISQFGIHIIKRTEYGTAAEIKDALEQDILKMADDSSLPSTTSLVAELTQVYTNSKVMEILLGDADFKTELGKQLDEYNKDKTDEVDKVKIDDVTDTITEINKLQEQTDLDEAMGDKLENWLTTQLDAGLRTLPAGINLDDIYGWAEKLIPVVKPAPKTPTTTAGTGGNP